MKFADFLVTILAALVLMMLLLILAIKNGKWCVPLDDHTQRCVVTELRPR